MVMEELVGTRNDYLQRGLVVLAGGGTAPEQLRRGRERVGALNETIYSNRLRRVRSTGIDEETALRLADLQTQSQRTGYGSQTGGS